MPQKQGENDKFMLKIIKNHTKTWKNDNLMSKIDTDEFPDANAAADEEAELLEQMPLPRHPATEGTFDLPAPTPSSCACRHHATTS